MKWVKRKSIEISNKEAFTYIVKFDDGCFYIGYKKFKTIKGQPTNWENYNTSSKYVKAKLKNKDAKWIILKTFDTYLDALKHEEMLLAKYFNHPKILNRCIGGHTFYKHPDTPEHIAKLSKAKLGTKLTDKHRKNIKSAVKAYYRENGRSAEHTTNNISARTSKIQISIKIKGKTFRSFAKASAYLGCAENEVESHPLVLSITTTIHKVPDFVIIDDIKYKNYVSAAKAIVKHPSFIKDCCLSDDYPNFIVSYKRA